MCESQSNLLVLAMPECRAVLEQTPARRYIPALAAVYPAQQRHCYLMLMRIRIGLVVPSAAAETFFATTPTCSENQAKDQDCLGFILASIAVVRVLSEKPSSNKVETVGHQRSKEVP